MAIRCNMIAKVRGLHDYRKAQDAEKSVLGRLADGSSPVSEACVLLKE